MVYNIESEIIICFLLAVAKSRQKNSSYSNQHLKGKSLQQRNTMSAYFSSLISLLSSFTVNEILIKVILTLLTGLLLSNSILFYKLWNLEEKLIEQPVNTDYFDFFNDHVSSSSKTEKNVANSMSNNPPSKGDSTGDMNQIYQNTDWLKLLHRQEVAHQLELEKWHAILGAATDLLRKVCMQKLVYIYNLKYQGSHPPPKKISLIPTTLF